MFSAPGFCAREVADHTLMMALALARTGSRVGIIDADIYGPNVPIMLGLQGQLGTNPFKLGMAAGLVAGSLLWFLLYLKFWKKVGRDYRYDDIPPYYREPPSELRPAFVEVLLREGGSPTPRSFTATLFDLARRGYLEFTDRAVEYNTIDDMRKALADLDAAITNASGSTRSSFSLAMHSRD